MMFIEIYTDGSATVAEKPGGYGWVMVIDGKKESEGSGHMAFASNNDAELEAAIEGLSAAHKWMAGRDLRNIKINSPCPKTEVVLVSDSQLILGWANGTLVFRQLDKLEKFKKLQFYVKMLDVETRWVQGHTGDEHNERCDQLANEARTGAKKEKKSKKSKIGQKSSEVVCFWYKNVLKILDLERNIIEDHSEELHGKRVSKLEFSLNREDYE
jgi:ribonuclease HI